MKKIFTPALAAIALLGMNAQAADLHYLKEVRNTTGFDITSYAYNENNKVTNIHHIDLDMGPQSSVERVIEYNDKGLVVAEIIWQDYYETENRDQYICTSKVEYEYNDKDQLAVRTTYMADLTQFERPLNKNAIMKFSYNDKGQMIEVTTAFAINNGKIIQRDEYEYNDKGLLDQKKTYSTNYTNNGLSYVVQYKYNDEDQISQIIANNYDPTYQTLVPSGYTDYKYDAQGNLSVLEQWNNSHAMLVSKKEYTYSTEFTIDNTVYPINFEDSFWNPDFCEFELVRQPIMTRSDYSINDTTSQLEFTEKYEYEYTLTRPTSTTNAVETVEGLGVGSSIIFKGIEAGRAILDGIASEDSVRLFDLEGRTIFSGFYGNGVKVEELPAGTYFITSSKGVVKFAK